MLHVNPMLIPVALTPQDIFEAYLACSEDWLEGNTPTFEVSNGPSPYSDAQDLIDAILCDTLENDDPGTRLREHLDHVRGSLRVLVALVNGFDNFEVGALAILSRLNNLDSAELNA